MIVIGLTGSIGMGKTTTAKLFADEGVPVCDSDAVVHDLYRSEAVSPIAVAFPQAVQEGRVNRDVLSHILRENPAQFRSWRALSTHSFAASRTHSSPSISKMAKRSRFWIFLCCSRRRQRAASMLLW